MVEIDNWVLFEEPVKIPLVSCNLFEAYGLVPPDMSIMDEKSRRRFGPYFPEENFDFPIWSENSIPRGRNLSIHQINIGAELQGNKRQIYKNHLKILTDLLKAKKLKPPLITNVGSLSVKTVQKAHKLLESGSPKGKLIMTIRT